MKKHFLVGKPEGMVQLGTLMCGCEDDVEMDFKELKCEGVGCVYLVLDRSQGRALMNAITSLLVP
jgi:hypothetical protein